MQRFLIALAFAGVAACTPPAAPPSEGPPPAVEAPAVDTGPYTNSWDSAEFSRFRHTLHAPTPGVYELTLAATTNSPGGETVAVYPIDAAGAAETARIMFVIATTVGGAETEAVTIPAEGLPVEVAVENASGRALAGSYTLTLTPAAP